MLICARRSSAKVIRSDVGHLGRVNDMELQVGKWVKRYKVEEVIHWELYKKSLAEELTDDAENELQLYEIECSADVTLVGDEFVVTFTS